MNRPHMTDLWILYVDGSSITSMSRADIILTTSDRMVVEYALWFAFPASNNEAEYEALITGLKLVKELEAQKLKVFNDSQLVIGQVNGEFKAQSPSMIKYLGKVLGNSKYSSQATASIKFRGLLMFRLIF